MAHIGHDCYILKVNKRVQESKQMIANALLTLVQKDDYAFITITQICQEAQICRNTFYRNFNSKDDILSYLIESITKKIYTQTLASINDSMDENTLFEQIYRTFFSCWQDEKALLSAIIKHNLYVLFSAQFFSCFSQHIILLEDQFEENTTILYQDYLQNSISSMMTGMLMTWAQHDFRESLQEIIDITMHLQHLHFTICNNTTILGKKTD